MSRRGEVIEAILAGTVARFAARDPRRVRLVALIAEAAQGAKLEDSAWLGRALKDTEDGDLEAPDGDGGAG